MKHKQLRNKKNLKLSSLKLIILLIILFIGFTLSGKYTGFFIYNETNLTEQNITGNQVLNDTSQINISVNEDNVIEYSNITNDTELIDSIEENITIINETENINEYSNVTDNLELNNTKIINESIKKIKEGKSFNLNEKVKDDKGNEVAKKIKDDKNFDVFFIDVIKSDKLYLQFYHNSDETQPIWIEGDINYELSDKEAIGYQMINLSVDLVNREVPNFKLHIGKESEVFEFGITIINVHSFPSLYGNWTVMFNTTGTADLKITATIDTNYTNEYTRWSDNSEDSDLYDLRFLEIKCGDIILNYEWQGTNCNENECSVFISNYSCNETAYEISRVLKAREHVLKFEFGDDSAFAYNANSNPVVSNVVLNSTTNGTCGALYSNLTVAFDVSDADGNNTKNITNWYLNNKSIQLLNLPFEGGSLSGTTNGVIGGTKDYSGLGYTITVNNVTYVPNGGYDGFGAYNFTGNKNGNETIVMSGSNINSLKVDNFTISFWANPHSTIDNTHQFIYAPSSTWGYLSFYDAGSGPADSRYLYFNWRNSAFQVISNNCYRCVVPDVWSYYTIRVNSYGNNVNTTMFRDAVPIYSSLNVTGFSKSYTWSGTSFLIGNNRYFLNMTLDDFVVYNRSLSDEEILFINNSKHHNTLSSAEIGLGDVWQINVTANDGVADSSSVESNYLEIVSSCAVANTAPYFYNITFWDNVTTNTYIIPRQFNGSFAVGDLDSNERFNVSTFWYEGNTIIISNNTAGSNMSNYTNAQINGTMKYISWNLTKPNFRLGYNYSLGIYACDSGGLCNQSNSTTLFMNDSGGRRYDIGVGHVFSTLVDCLNNINNTVNNTCSIIDGNFIETLPYTYYNISPHVMTDIDEDGEAIVFVQQGNVSLDFNNTIFIPANFTAIRQWIVWTKMEGVVYQGVNLTIKNLNGNNFNTSESRTLMNGLSYLGVMYQASTNVSVYNSSGYFEYTGKYNHIFDQVSGNISFIGTSGDAYDVRNVTITNSSGTLTIINAINYGQFFVRNFNGAQIYLGLTASINNTIINATVTGSITTGSDSKLINSSASQVDLTGNNNIIDASTIINNTDACVISTSGINSIVKNSKLFCNGSSSNPYIIRPFTNWKLYNNSFNITGYSGFDCINNDYGGMSGNSMEIINNTFYKCGGKLYNESEGWIFNETYLSSYSPFTYNSNNYDGCVKIYNSAGDASDTITADGQVATVATGATNYQLWLITDTANILGCGAGAKTTLWIPLDYPASCDAAALAYGDTCNYNSTLAFTANGYGNPYSWNGTIINSTLYVMSGKTTPPYLNFNNGTLYRNTSHWYQDYYTIKHTANNTNITGNNFYNESSDYLYAMNITGLNNYLWYNNFYEVGTQGGIGCYNLIGNFYKYTIPYSQMASGECGLINITNLTSINPVLLNWTNQSSYIELINYTLEYVLNNERTHIVITNKTNYSWTYPSLGNYIINIVPNDGYTNGTNRNFTFNVINSCTYSSGDWYINCTDNCDITSDINLGGNNIYFTNAGALYLKAKIENYNIISLSPNCNIILYSGGQI